MVDNPGEKLRRKQAQDKIEDFSAFFPQPFPEKVYSRDVFPHHQQLQVLII